MSNMPSQDEFKGQPLSHVLRDVERRYFCWALNEADGNKTAAAKLAGLTYPTFIRKLAELDLKVSYSVG